MVRAIPEDIDSGLSGWDADISTNFDLVFTDPVPLAEFANAAALPAPSSNDDSLAITTDTHELWISDTVDWVAPNPEHIIIAIGDETTVITTGTALVTFRMPYLFKLEEIRASLTTADNSLVTVDVNDGGTTVFSTGLTIDSSELTSTTAATPAVISDDTLADDAEITIDIDGVGTAGTGLKVTLIGRKMAL